MTDLDDTLTDDEHRRIAKEMYERWQVGEKKSRLEIEYRDDATSQGKHFTSYTKRWLGVRTESKSSQTQHVERLEGLLRANGISPTDAGDLDDQYRLLAKARESALSAVRGYNDPLAGFRAEAFIVLMVIAWNALFQAILERDGTDYWARDEHGQQVKIDGRPKATRHLGTCKVGDRRSPVRGRSPEPRLIATCQRWTSRSPASPKRCSSASRTSW